MLIQDNSNIIIDIYPVKSKIEEREQNAIIISTKKMIKYLDKSKENMYGLDFTYKIIPWSFSLYKLMTIYAIDEINKSIVIAWLICIKYVDTNSLLKLFGLLNISYNYNPKCVTTDFSLAQIKALKECTSFDNSPYVVPCIFLFAQAIIKKFRELKINKNSLNKKDYELLRNLEILKDK